MIVRSSLIGLALLLGTIAAPASAQITGGARLRTVDYYPGQVTRIEAAPGFQLAIEFAPDERIENVAVGDSAAWQATPNKRGDRMFLKLVNPGVATNMVVITDVREYLFDLVPLPGADPRLAYIVRFRAPVAAAPPSVGTVPNAASGVVGRYHVTGERTLRPSGIEDDGVHTFLQWPLNVGLPAVYAVDALGRESLVNGMVRGNLFVVDSVSDALVFRLDRKVARATRLADKRK
jgi:type IV secretion system protein VirB9